MFDLDKALENVNNVRKKGKKSKSTKMWHKVFDEMYSVRLNKNGSQEIINIVLENKHLVR